MLRRPMAVRSIIAVVAYLVTAGCSADVVAPRGPGSSSALRSGEPGAAAVPNRIKYRDSGLRPATGRSGAAALTARALVDRAGTASLELTTGALDEAGAASLTTGMLTRVQVKGFAPDGALLFVESHEGSNSGLASYSYDGLVRGTRLEVQTHVRAAESRRVEVVTVDETVKLRPDVAAGSLDMPRHARVGTPVNIAATVREVNGDVGARADCVLYVDGAAADRASGIWVDAGGVVSCAFTPSFAQPGVRQLEVRLENVTPGDYDSANNGATDEIEVTTDPYRTDAYARDLETSYSLSSTVRVTRLSDGMVTEGGSSTGGGGREQSSGLTAEMDYGLTFPLSHVAVSQSTGGTLLHQASYDNVPGNANGGRCFSQQYTPNGQGRLFLCTASGKTLIQYVRWAGDVSYYSESYSRTWDASGAVVGTPVYSWNGSSSAGGEIVPFLGDLTIRVRIDDEGGIYNTVVEVPLQPYLHRIESPLTCVDSYNVQQGTSVRSCSETHWLDRGMVGTRRDWAR